MITKIPAGKLILRDDRTAIASVLVDGIIENLGTWYKYLNLT